MLAPTRRPRPSSARVVLNDSVRVAVEFLESRMLLAGGALDPTFGAGGKVLTDFPGTQDDGVRHAALQSDGKIVVLTGADAGDARLARYTADGVLDTTFGSGGSVVLSYKPGALAVRPDNRIVVAGYDAANDDNVLLARYAADGQVDTLFGGGDGQMSQPAFGGDATFRKVFTRLLVGIGNTLYLAGSAENGSFTNQYNVALSSYLDTGEPNPQFGDQYINGTLVDFGNSTVLGDATLAPSGHIVLAGTKTISSSHHPFVLEDFAVARYDLHGLPDGSFSGDGKTTVSFGTYPQSHPMAETGDSFDLAQSVAVDANNNVVVAGISRDPTDEDPFFTAVAKLTAAGNPDPTFGPGGNDGGDGRVRLPLTTASGPFARHEVATLAGGKLLVATAAHGTTGRDWVLARVNPGGALDTSFGTGGKAMIDFGSDELLVGDLLMQSGKAVLTGGSPGPATQPGIAPMRLAMARYQLDAEPTQGPFGGTPLAVPGILEFENFDDGGEGVAYHDTDPENRGGAWRDTGVDIQRVPDNDINDHTLAFAKAGEWTEYTVHVAQAGTYDVAIEYASLRGGGKFHLEVDDRVVTPVTTVPPTGDWRNYRTLTLGGINLTAGDHVFRLEMDANDSIGYVANFNRARFTLRATPPSNQSPFGLQPISLPGVLSFEDYDRGGEGVAYHDTEPQNLGGAYRSDGADVQVYPNGATVLAFARAGEWTEYTVDVTQGGVQGISLNYSSLRGGGKFHLEVDGVRLTPTFTLPGTASWEEYRWLHLGQFNLPAGRHVIRLSMDANDSTGYVGNFNHAAFRFIAPVAPAPFRGAPFQPNQQIEAEDYDAGGEGVAYHDTERQNLGGAYRPTEGVDVQPTGDVGGGHNVGFTRPGEYLIYTVSTATGGTYGLQMRMAALREGGSGTVEVDGDHVFAFDVPATGDWQKYATISYPKEISLAPGVHTIRVRTEFADSTGYVGNFNWLKLVS